METTAGHSLALAQSQGDELAAKRVAELAEMGPDDRTKELALMYVAIERLSAVKESAIWALDRAQRAVLVGGELTGGDGKCDCVSPYPADPRSCELIVLHIGGEHPMLPPNHVMLKCAVVHARAMKEALSLTMSTFKLLQSSHQSCGNWLRALGI